MSLGRPRRRTVKVMKMGITKMGITKMGITAPPKQQEENDDIVSGADEEQMKAAKIQAQSVRELKLSLPIVVSLGDREKITLRIEVEEMDDEGRQALVD